MNQPGRPMLMRPEVDEAKSMRPRPTHEAEAKIAFIFFSQILHFCPILFLKKQNFWSIFDGTSTILAQTGFHMGTLLVNTPKTTSDAFGRRLYCFCVYTLNRKCHRPILSVKRNKTLQQHFKNYEAKLDEAEATTVMRPMAEANNHETEAGTRT